MTKIYPSSKHNVSSKRLSNRTRDNSASDTRQESGTEIDSYLYDIKGNFIYAQRSWTFDWYDLRDMHYFSVLHLGVNHNHRGIVDGGIHFRHNWDMFPLTKISVGFVEAEGIFTTRRKVPFPSTLQIRLQQPLIGVGR